jgi:hypothetical protein
VAERRSHFVPCEPKLGRGRSTNVCRAAPFAPMTPAVINVDDARHSRRAGCRGGAAASQGIVARTGSATANGLDLWADGVSVATFDFRPDSCGTGRLLPGRRLARRASRRRDIDPRSDGSAFRAAQARLALQTFEMRHRQALLVVRSRQVCVAGIARTDRVCFRPGAIRSAGVQTSLGINCRREPPRPAVTSQLASPARRQVLSPQGHGLQAFRSLCWGRAEGKRARTPAGSIIGTRPPGRCGNPRRSTAPAPQSNQ